MSQCHLSIDALQGSSVAPRQQGVEWGADRRHGDLHDRFSPTRPVKRPPRLNDFRPVFSEGRGVPDAAIARAATHTTSRACGGGRLSSDRADPWRRRPQERPGLPGLGAHERPSSPPASRTSIGSSSWSERTGRWRRRAGGCPARSLPRRPNRPAGGDGHELRVK